jgi:hypothetical protein
MPAIRAIYFSTIAHAKKRVIIYENPLNLNFLTGRFDPSKSGAKRLIIPAAACAGRPTSK